MINQLTATIVVRLTDSCSDGKWLTIPVDRVLVLPRMLPPSQMFAEDPPMRPSVASVRMVPTGNVEWDGERVAEVYVPEDKLAEWRAEWDMLA